VKGLNEIILIIGTPKFGWLPINLRCEGYKLEIQASNIPRNPLEQLCSSLIQLLMGVNEPPEVLLHLEPQCYYWQFLNKNGNFFLEIYKSENYEGERKFVKEINGSFNEIIFPFYCGLNDFAFSSYDNSDWEKIELARIKKLSNLIKKYK